MKEMNNNYSKEVLMNNIEIEKNLSLEKNILIDKNLVKEKFFKKALFNYGLSFFSICFFLYFIYENNAILFLMMVSLLILILQSIELKIILKEQKDLFKEINANLIVNEEKFSKDKLIDDFKKYKKNKDKYFLNYGLTLMNKGVYFHLKINGDVKNKCGKDLFVKTINPFFIRNNHCIFIDNKGFVNVVITEINLNEEEKSLISNNIINCINDLTGFIEEKKIKKSVDEIKYLTESDLYNSVSLNITNYFNEIKKILRYKGLSKIVEKEKEIVNIKRKI